MTERPILFTPENAQKCHEGTKTQTRRIVKLPSPIWDYPQMTRAGVVNFLDSSQANPYNDTLDVACPYGQAGDRLWVRETFALWREGFDRRGHVVYRADMKDKDGEDFSRPDLMGLSKWYPSIHMKRVYSRLTLEITEIRVQRLQEISEEDAIAEGIERVGGAASCNPWKNYRLGKPGEMAMHCSCPTRSYMTLWESINGPGSWAANPWVWCVSFKRVNP